MNLEELWLNANQIEGEWRRRASRGKPGDSMIDFGSLLL